MRTFTCDLFVSVKDLEKAAGTLNFACQALPAGCPFLAHIYALQYARGDHHMPRKIPRAIYDDLLMFWEFLSPDSPIFVRTVPFLRRLGQEKQPVDIKVDASGSSKKGFGCWCDGRWAQGMWSETGWFTPGGLEAHKFIY